jgi:cobalt-zinc-cadmium efflux system outer membrane protein
MINRLIDVALKNRFTVIALYLGLAAWGWWALRATPIDAIPDLSDNQVIVFTDWQGHSPQEVEDQITYPLTTNLQGLAGVRVVRSQSAFGFSMIYVVLEDDVDLYFARTRVLERMSLVAKNLPAGVTPTLGPDATDIQQVIETAVGETTITMTIEGRERFPVRVRYAPEYRADPQALGRVLVASPSGALQLLGRRLGRFHRVVRHGGANGRRDGHLPRRSSRAKAPGSWWHVDEGSPQRCRDGRGGPPAAAEGDDGVDRHRRSPAHHVEHAGRRGGHEAARDAGARRHAVVAGARAHRDACHLFLANRCAGPVFRDCGVRDGWRLADGHRVGWASRQGVSQLRRRRAVTTRIARGVLIATLLSDAPAWSQPPAPSGGLAERYVDASAGLSLEQAIARAFEQEPSLRAVRSQIDVAQGMRLQAGLRPNPSVSFERREEPGGTDNQTMVAVGWPLDLFRRSRRVAVADREVATAQFAAADRARLLAAEVRMRYGELLAAIRELRILDELVAVTRRQHELLRSRVDEGAAPPLDRDLLDVELRRLRAERLLQAARTEAALVELKRILGMTADSALTVRDTLETRVQAEVSAAPLVSNTESVLDQRADVRESLSRVGVAEAKIARAQAQGRFDVTLFANYMRMDAGFPQQAFAPDGSLGSIRGLFHYVAAGAMVTVPILNRNQGEVAAARAERDGATAAHEAARLAAGAELAAARVRDEGAREAVRLYSTGTQALARQNLTVVAQSHELGRVTVFDVLTEQRRYLDVERAYTSALREAYEARTALNRALGGVR